MGYAIEALIGPTEVLEPFVRVQRTARLAPLVGPLALLPMVEILRNAIQRQNHDPEREPRWPFWYLSPEGAMNVAETCEKGPLVYVEARFYAGVGTQASVGWCDGALRHGPVVAPDAINRALRFLGVQPQDGKDEFDTVGLGRRRSTDDWTREAKRP
jgi:hypothetical protein